MMESLIEKDSREKHLSVFLPFHKNLGLKIGKLKTYIDVNDVDIEKIFKEHDKNNKGYVNQIQFSYIMTQYYKILFLPLIY